MIPDSLRNLAGEWSGTNYLWLDPSKPAAESPSNLTVAVAAGGLGLLITYTWADDGKPQEGVLLLGPQSEAVWLDSWHQSTGFMHLRGSVTHDGFSVTGSYAAPPDPDWGWRIELHPLKDAVLRLRMWNITPTGEEARAVECRYERIPG